MASKLVSLTSMLDDYRNTTDKSLLSSVSVHKADKMISADRPLVQSYRYFTANFGHGEVD